MTKIFNDPKSCTFSRYLRCWPPAGSAGQVSPVGATFAVGALLMTSAILTFLVGVFALAANDLVVSGPGYEYT